ncbi:Indolepyruvate decarboxylase [Bacillus cereus AH1272]|nr:Indolepyruvate decarboxylase [Bacillus cereus AH1272]EEL93611.1 Indolepyruvate decarboxylase [Bacillus cereus AH1273]
MIQLQTQYTVSTYLLDRLNELGIEHIFGVPGDYNLAFLDDVLVHKNLEWIGNCNELNAAYAADGHARIQGIAASKFLKLSHLSLNHLYLPKSSFPKNKSLRKNDFGNK